ncbi:MAG: ABC transporter permease [Vicinamibacterales bacterium]
MTQGIGQDFRHALRHLRAHPGYGAAVVLTLALAIGGVTAVFTLADPLLFKPLPYPNADRIVRLGASSDVGRTMMYYADYLWLTQGTASFEAVAQFSGPEHTGTLHEDDPPETDVLVYAVPPTFLDLFGVQPAIGRGFEPHEHVPAGARVALITHGLWQRAFGGSAAALGKSLKLHGPGGATFDVIGVLPRDFVFPDFVNRAPGVLIPGRDDLADAARPNVMASPFALLKRGVSREQAAIEIQRAFDEVRRDNPAMSVRRSPVITPLKDALFTRVRKPLLTLLALTFLVMLLAFANITHLILARIAARRGEIATRQALGGSRWRTGRLLFVESAALAFLGLAGALLAGRITLDAILGLLPRGAHVYRAIDVGLDARVFLLACGLTLVGLMLFGGVPALKAVRADVRGGLQHQSSRSTSRWGMSSLVFAQTATAIAVLVAALLVAANFSRLANADLGYDPEGVSTAYLTLPRTAVGDQARAERASTELRRRIAEFVGRPVALGSGIPGMHLVIGLGRVDWPKERRMVTSAFPVSTEFRDVFRLRLAAGRWFSAEEGMSAQPLVVVDARTAMLLWPGQNPIGQLARDSEGIERRVIGVVEPLKTSLAGTRFQQSTAFVPLRKTWRAPLTTMWRGRITPAMRAELRRFARELEPQGRLSISELNLVDRQLGQPRFLATLLGSLAAVAGLLTLIGLYGVVSHNAVRRTREVGIRIALGADRGAIARLVVMQTLMPAILGMALGLAISVWWTETIRSLLVGIEPHDWRVFASSAVALLAIVGLASWLPARRATRIDPMIALRAE